MRESKKKIIKNVELEKEEKEKAEMVMQEEH